jgi:hypothetical protein
MLLHGRQRLLRLQLLSRLQLGPHRRVYRCGLEVSKRSGTAHQMLLAQRKQWTPSQQFLLQQIDREGQRTFRRECVLLAGARPQGCPDD